MPTTPAPTPTPVAYADTLRIGEPGGLVRAWGGSATGTNSELDMGHAIFGFLHQYDAHFDIVPDLADGPCFVPGADSRVLRCRIKETTFHDGTPVTADDVAYSYRFYGFDPNGLKEVRVVDPRAVDLVFASIDTACLPCMTPGVPIVPQHAVEASYAAFLAATKDDTAKSLTTLADTIDADLARDPAVCSPHVDAVATLFGQLGVAYYREDYVDDDTGAFDPCGYVGNASWQIRAAADALGKTGFDAVAAAYPVLSINFHPIGAGPYSFVSEDANRVHLEAFPGYYGGIAATKYLDFVRTKAHGSDLLDGSVDIWQYAPRDVAFQAAAASHGVRFATVPSTGGVSYYLGFNVRPGRLFADLALRKALQLCIDLPRDVEAATGGTGIPIYGPIPFGLWAYDPDLPKPGRDVAAAKRLIEDAGWRLGADGVYVKDKVRLAAAIVGRAARTPRIRMADLIAAEARDCGMDLRNLPLDDDDYFTAMHYPSHIPGTDTPWDLLLYGWMTMSGSLARLTSAEIPSAKSPDAGNYGGFSDPLIDRLDAAQKRSYDRVERTRLLRQGQEEIVAKLPELALWIDTEYDAVRSAVTTVDGPLDLTAPNWIRVQLTRMVVAANK